MKYLVIVLLCMSIAIGGEAARASIGAKLDRYAAEMAIDQMDAEGSEAYEIYRRTADTVYTAINVSEATACCVAVLCVAEKIKNMKENKE